MTRICVVAQDPALEGGELTKLEAFARWAGSRGHRCILIHPAEGNGDAAVRRERAAARLEATGTVETSRAVRIAGWTPHFVRAASFARRARLPGGCGVYQLVSGTLDLGLPLVRASVPFVAWVAGTYGAEIAARPRERLRHHALYNPVCDALTRRQEVRVGRAARRVLAVSHPAAGRLVQDLGLPAARIGALPVGVDTDRFRPAAGGDRSDRETRPYVFSAARLDRGKGFPTLLRAFRRVATARPAVRLRIAGEGPERGSLEALARSLGVAERVRFDGHLSGAELVAAYRGARAFALASRYEALGIVVLEAMACGLPVVCTDCGGVRDAVVPGRTGHLVPVGDDGRLADRLLELLEHPARAAAMGEAGRDRALRRFRAETLARRLDEVYERAFGRGGV